MNKTEKERYLGMPTVGVSATLRGLEVKDIVYGIEDSIIFVIPDMKGRLKVHRARIRYDKPRTYFLFEDYLIYLDEIIRC